MAVRFVRRCALIVGLAGASAQGSPLGAVAAQVSAPLDSTDRQIIDAWLFCTECIESQLDSVLALYARKPATLDTLARDLLAGLTAVRRTNLEDESRSYHSALRKDSIGSPLPSSPPTSPTPESTYVARALVRANNLSRRRAAIALARIGGAAARDVLNRAVDSIMHGSSAFRSPVGPTVLFARDSIWQP